MAGIGEILSDTIRRYKGMKKRLDEIMSVFDCTEEKAIAILIVSDVDKVREIAEKIDARQEQEITAENRAKAAYAATFRSNVEVK